MSFRTALYTTIFTLAIVMVITLIVFWNIYIISDYRTIKELYEAVDSGHQVPAVGRWTVLVLGITFLSLLIVVLSVFFANLLRGNRFKRQQRDFVNMVTHELRLPLSSIQVFAQTLHQRPVNAEAKEKFVDGILSECGRLGLLIDQLLKLQQIEHGKLPVHKAPLDAGVFLRDFADRWPRPLNIQAGASARIEADPVLLELALANLVNNAEKYGRGGMPEVTLTHAGREVQFAVRDQGRPLSKQEGKRIFRKFYRLSNSDTKRQSGVGLGLYIVKYIASLHKGTVRLASAAEAGPAGNEFRLRLPEAA